MKSKSKVCLVIILTLIIVLGGLTASFLLLKNRQNNKDIVVRYEEDFYETTTAIDQNKLLMKQDSDNDGYSDITELLVGSDPDKKEKFNKSNPAKFVIENESAKLELEGTPNIANTYAAEYNSASIKNKSLMLSPVYELYNETFSEDIFSAKLSLTYKGEPDDDVAIYQYIDDGSLVIVENSTVSGNTVTATLEHFSKYTVARRVLEDISSYSERAFAICVDDSGSMFTNVMLEDSNKEGNDPTGARWDFVKSFFEKYSDDLISCYNYTGSNNKLVDFEMSNSDALNEINKHIKCVQTIAEFKQDEVVDKVTEVPDAHIKFNGTNTANSAVEALQDLSVIKAKTKYLIILTDGGDTTTSQQKQFMTEIQSSDVIPICIVLGKDVAFKNIELYSQYNNGQSIWLSSADVFSELEKILNTVMDGKDAEVSKVLSKHFGREIEVETLADSGYRKEKDSLPFLNTSYRMKETSPDTMGLCFGIAYTEQERYVTGFTYSKKSGYEVNAVTATLSPMLNWIYDKIELKYLTKDNYNEVLDYLANIISVTKRDYAVDEGLAEYRTMPNGHLVKVPKSIDTAFVKTFFYTKEHNLLVDTDGDGTKELIDLVDVHGKKYQGDMLIHPIYTKIHKAVKSDFKEYTNLTEIEKASLEWINMLIYNFNLQMKGLPVRTLGDSCYESTIGEEIVENLKDWLKGWEGKGYFGFDKEEFTLPLSIYNSLKAGIPALCNFTENTSGGGHTVLCTRMFRDVQNPTIIYLEIDDSNRFEPQYFEIKFETALVQCSNAVNEEYTIEKMNLKCPHSIIYTTDSGNHSYISTSVDTEQLKHWADNL